RAWKNRAPGPGPAAPPPPLAGAAAERLCDLLELLGRDRSPVIGDGQDTVSGSDLDSPALLVVADRVVDEVVHEPLDQSWVTCHDGWVKSCVDAQLAAVELRR